MSRKRHEPHEEHIDESWLLPYSDLMTLLLALFIVLYAASSVNTAKLEELSQAFKTAFSSGIGVLDHSTILEDNEAARRTNQDNTRKSADNRNKSQATLKEEEQQNLEQLKMKLDEYIEQNGLSSALDTLLNQSELLITIRDNALFAPASAIIKPDSQKLAVTIGQMLDEYPDYEIQVIGHTDNKPIRTLEFPSNWELSSKRAINFMKILLENPEFDPGRFSAIGFGEYRPLGADSNATEAGRAKNRRVEVSILRKYSEPTAIAQ